MKRMSIVLVLLLKSVICFPQNSIKMTGQLFNNDRKPVASAHLVVEGTSVGTLSNGDGFFELKIPKQHCTSNLIISHVGYQSVSYQISCKNETNLVFNLIESSTQLDSLNIGDISAKQVVRNAIENLEKNHEVKTITYTIFGRLEEKIDGELDLLREFVVNAYHEENSKADIQIVKARGKGFTKPGIERLKESRIGGVYLLHYHLLLRYLPDFLEKGKVNKYDFQFLDDVEVDGQKYYSISVDSDRYTKGGELWIHPVTFAIKYLKKITEDESWKNTSRLNTISESYYTESEGKWYLSYGVRSYTLVKEDKKRTIDMRNTYIVLDRELTRKFDKKEDMGLMVKFFKEFQSDFYDGFWKDYNYIDLQRKFIKK
ncbi:MAG: hypothetical protein ACI85I_000405 [Arenicella sp.]|jgi:hypothetical protein